MNDPRDREQYLSKNLQMRMQQLVANYAITDVENKDTMHLYRLEAQSIMREVEKELTK